MASEESLKEQLCTLLRAGLHHALVFRHEDHFRIGLPDISVTWNGFTTWIEAKYANPRLKGRKIQAYTAMQLAAQGKAFYVIWGEKEGVKRTFLVNPQVVFDKAWEFDLPGHFDGFDHGAVLNRIKVTHK